MNNLTDTASENQRQWKSINALTAEVKTLSGTVGAGEMINHVDHVEEAGND